MSHDKIVSLFSQEKGYHFSRWNKPIAPVVFGIDNSSLASVKSAFLEVISITPLPISDFDSDLGANFFVFFCSEWCELREIPNLNRLIPNLAQVLATLDKNNSNQYRTFFFKENGAINLCILIMKYDLELASVSVQTLAMGQMLKSILLWSPKAFATESPIAIINKNNSCIVKPFYEALLKACYDATLPDFSMDKTHALRVQARVSKYTEEFK